VQSNLFFAGLHIAMYIFMVFNVNYEQIVYLGMFLNTNVVGNPNDELSVVSNPRFWRLNSRVVKSLSTIMRRCQGLTILGCSQPPGWNITSVQPDDSRLVFLLQATQSMTPIH